MRFLSRAHLVSNYFFSDYLMEEETKKIGKGKRFIKFIFGLVIVLLVVWAGISLYAGFSVKELEPEASIKTMMSKITKSPAFSVVSDLIVQDIDKQRVSNFKIDLAADLRRASKPKVLSSIFVQYGSSLTATGTAPSVFKVAGEIRSDNQIVYLRLTDASGFESASYEPFINQWFSISYDKAENSYSGALEEKGINRSTLDVLLEQSKKVRELFLNYPIIAVVEEFPNEEISGDLVYHYKAKWDTDNIKQISDGIAKLSGFETSTSSQPFSPFFGQPFEIWIGKTDNYPQKIIILPPEEMSSTTNKIYSGEIVFGEFNKKISVEIPTNAVALEDLVKSIFNQ